MKRTLVSMGLAGLIKGFALASLFLLPSVASAAFIETLFARNNGSSVGGAVYFNLTTGTSGINITALTTNTSETLSATTGFEIYTKLGTAQGFESDALAWALATTATITPSGLDNPSPVALDSPIMLDANTLYGIALVMPATVGHDYTNGSGCVAYGSGGNCEFSNADLTLNLGAATNTPFTASVFNPRTWNGSITYDLKVSVPEPGTLLLMGLGLAGLGFSLRRRLHA